MQCIDAYSWDVRSVEEDLRPHRPSRLIPFGTYNLFYGDDLERTRLVPLRAGRHA